ncbi:DNA-(apurinic or apyrimidinic site) lyase /endonuclease III [Granulicatella balaenopterae]|uniref:Endonuclease III n=1 Tax=Granulicatella balaenopterae TaxID=137733 RepID=A0A1H9K0I7_9LACT|nr:endonuclease III [Granulicatella balaenopterae]SEQ92497.1 DNA-(apurinic or apyrimidinic site) lyase /endonuclease III [Granulicatella balaenopterae]
MLSKVKTIEALDRMQELFPQAECELVHQTPFQLLIATILSAQATDVSVNKVTPALFQAYPNAEKMAEATQEELIHYIKTLGLYRNKAKSISNCAKQLVEKYNGQVPQTREELVELPGVGRKTANVVLSVAFGEPAFAVDTHVERIAKRLHIVRQKDSVLEVEKTLCRKIPRERWSKAHHTMIFFGRYHCIARAPKCDSCPLIDLCVFGQRKMEY